jgi:hypothetical protein
LETSLSWPPPLDLRLSFDSQYQPIEMPAGTMVQAPEKMNGPDTYRLAVSEPRVIHNIVTSWGSPGGGNPVRALRACTEPTL